MVFAFGAKSTLAFGISFLLGSSAFSPVSGDSVDELGSLDAMADVLDSSSSRPKDSLPFVRFLRFFLGGWGVDALRFGRKFHAHCLNDRTKSYPSLGVDAPEAGVALPDDLSRPSLSFTSSASARLLRKSDSWTSPMVWDLRRSSAVAF